MKRKILAALGLLAVLTTAAIGAGMFQGYPLVGGAATCVSFNTNPVTGAVLTTCNGQAVPAGPTGITGSERVPADTNLAQGINPATVLITTPMLASGGYFRIVPTAGNSYTIPNNVTNYVMVPAGTLATLTLTMPATPQDGQIVRITSSKTITALTLSANAGQTILNAPTAITLSTTGSYNVALIYVTADATWYRVQ